MKAFEEDWSILEKYDEFEDHDEAGGNCTQMPRIEAFSDANFVSDKADEKSMTSGVLYLNGMSIS